MKTKQKVNNTPFVINVTGTCGKTTTVWLLYTLLLEHNLNVGLASSLGLFINNKRIKKNDCATQKNFNYLYEKRNSLDVIICETVLRPPHPRLMHFYPEQSDSCIITNTGTDHIAHIDSKNRKGIADLKSEIIDHNKPSGWVILNADDTYTPFIVSKKEPEKLLLFSRHKPDIQKLNKLKPHSIHYAHKNKIYKLTNNTKTVILTSLDSMPLTQNMKLHFNVYNILAAVSALDTIKSLHINTKKVAKKLLTTPPMPGRFNVIKKGNITVVIDFAQNPKSYKQAFISAKSLPHKRVIAVINASSTKSEHILEKIGTIAAQYADSIYIKESFQINSTKRAVLQGKFANIVKASILKTSFPEQNITIISHEIEAVRHVLQNTQKSDLIIILGCNHYEEIQKEISSAL